MQSITTSAYRWVASLGAAGMTAAILLGIGVLAQPSVPVIDEREPLVARTAASTGCELAAQKRLQVTVLGHRAAPAAASELVQVGLACPIAAERGHAVQPTKAITPDEA